MLSYLEDVSVHVRAMGFNEMARFRSIEEFMLFNGGVFDRVSDEDLSDIKGVPHECFKNSALVVLSRLDLIYCEGYTSVGGFPLQHAWVTNDRGDLLEVTYDHPHDRYIGIAVTSSFLKSRLKRTKYFGLFTNIPTFDLEIINADPVSWQHPVMSKLVRFDVGQFQSRVESIKRLLEERKIVEATQIGT